LMEATPVSESIYVAKLSAKGSLKDPILLHSYIRMYAQRFGANSYKFESFNKRDATTGDLILSLYFSPDPILEANAASVPANKIYIFGDENLLSTKTQNFKINNSKSEIKAGHFIEINLAPDEQIRLSKGGNMISFIADGSPSVFCSFSGLGVSGAQHVVSGQGQGIGINLSTGGILPVDSNLALLLLHIYSEQQLIKKN